MYLFAQEQKSNKSADLEIDRICRESKSQSEYCMHFFKTPGERMCSFKASLEVTGLNIHNSQAIVIPEFFVERRPSRSQSIEIGCISCKTYDIQYFNKQQLGLMCIAIIPLQKVSMGCLCTARLNKKNQWTAAPGFSSPSEVFLSNFTEWGMGSTCEITRMYFNANNH